MGVGGEPVGEDVVRGEKELDASLGGFGESGFGDIDLVGFHETLAGGLALRIEEGVGHGAADQKGVGFLEEGVDDLDFVGDFGAADDGDEGAVGLGDGFAEVGELLFHEEAGSGLAAAFANDAGDAFGGGVGTVGGAEGVIDIDIAQVGELFGEVVVVLFFFGMEAKIFEKEGLPGFEVVGHFRGDFTDAIGGEADVFFGAEKVIEELAETCGDGMETQGVDMRAFGTAKMGGKDDPGALAQGEFEGGNGLTEARVVSDATVLEGDVEVDADENAFVAQVEVADGKLGGHRL